MPDLVPGDKTVITTGPDLAGVIRRALQRGLGRKMAATIRALIAEDVALKAACKKGKTRSTSRGVKAKGREGVVMAREWLLRLFSALQPDDILIQTTSVGGSDLHFSPLALQFFPFAPESKRVQSLNIWGALHQAEVNARKKNAAPVLFFSRAAASSSAKPEPLYIAFKAEDLALWLNLRAMPSYGQMPTKDAHGDGPGRSDQVTPEAGG